MDNEKTALGKLKRDHDILENVLASLNDTRDSLPTLLRSIALPNLQSLEDQSKVYRQNVQRAFENIQLLRSGLKDATIVFASSSKSLMADESDIHVLERPS